MKCLTNSYPSLESLVSLKSILVTFERSLRLENYKRQKLFCITTGKRNYKTLESLKVVIYKNAPVVKLLKMFALLLLVTLNY